MREGGYEGLSTGCVSYKGSEGGGLRGAKYRVRAYKGSGGGGLRGAKYRYVSLSVSKLNVLSVGTHRLCGVELFCTIPVCTYVWLCSKYFSKMHPLPSPSLPSSPLPSLPQIWMDVECEDILLSLREMQVRTLASYIAG